jgi:hypothetical protein
MRRLILVGLTLAALTVVLPSSSSFAVNGGPPPLGVTGLALSSSVQLAWQPVSGASAYNVYRGATPSSITNLLTSGGVTSTAFTDATANNGTAYYYAVRSIVGGVESTNSLTTLATPRQRTCSTGNAVVLENCFPGSNNWDVTNPAIVDAGGIEGYASATSINRGGSIDLKVNAADGTSFRMEVYRMGYYGGAEARLISTVPSVSAVRQPSCVNDSTTGLIDCSNWSVSATITTTSSWTSGVYMVRLVRLDTGTDNQVIFAVRDDGRASDLLYGVAFSNYQSYNNYGGKSLYTFNSGGNVTVSGTPRAVKVSYDRPFEQPRSGQRDWFTRNEAAMVAWLEQEGYDVSYISNTDLDQNGSLALGHHAYMSGAHDEYFSSGMRTALENARSAGVNLFFSGSNADYWRIRFENSPVSGGSNRVQVCYKSTESGGADPSGTPTGTWRDPAGANKPENALVGEMYVGDNDGTYFPLVVSAAQGGDRIYRFTPLASQPVGTSTSIGSTLVGWEWDARVSNGFEPAGMKTLATSPVTGNLIQGNGAFQTPGTASVMVTKYTAASGALVFATGTNHWSRGLANRPDGVGEPDLRIQQITTNVLEDMGVAPQTPPSSITLDNPGNGPPAPTGLSATATASDSISLSWNPVTGASGYEVYRLLQERQDGQPLGQLANPATITGTTFSDTGLSSVTPYYYVVTAIVSGVQSAASSEATATTLSAPGQPTYVNVGGPAYTSSTGQSYQADFGFSGGSLHSNAGAITGTNDPQLYQDERYGAFSYAIPVSNGTYNVRLHFAELYYGSTQPGPCTGKRIFSVDVLNTPASPDVSNLDICAAVGPLAALDRVVSNVAVTSGTLNIQFIRGAVDDPQVTAIDVIPAGSTAAPTVTTTTPGAGATGASLDTAPSAVFSTAMDPSTLTSSTFTLTAAGSTTPVPATVSYNAGTTAATLDPTSSLAPSTTYTATLSTAVKSAGGKPLASPFTWTFTTQALVGPQVTSQFPAGGATGISQNVVVRSQFDRSLDPSTVNGSTFTLKAGAASVSGTVNYDDTTRTATFSPTAPLSFSTTYTVTLGAAISSVAGVAMGSPVSWSFSTASGALTAPAVSATVPTAGAGGVSATTTVQATLSQSMDAASLTSSTFTLSGPSGLVGALVTYNQSTHVATLTPGTTLGASTTYTARLSTAVHNSSGEPLAGAFSWSFTTQAPPTVTSTSPVDGAGYLSPSTTVTATFSRAMDPSTITGASFTLTGPGGGLVAATVSYNASTNVATLTPSAPLAGAGTFTARVDATAKSADGLSLASPASWTFSTAACPCQLFSVVTQPATQNVSTRDGRGGTGPWTYEFGVKVSVDQPMTLTAIRFWKSSAETGTHVGNVWTSSGALLGSVTFTNETAAGWQQQALTTPLGLQPGSVYVVSVNANAFFSITAQGLQTQVIAGPLRSVADGANGVFGSAAGVFPGSSYNSTNYSVDLQVVPAGTVTPPTVTTTSPLGGATGVARGASVSATFSRSMDPATISGSTFSLLAPDGSQVPATVAYSASSLTASLTPSSLLAVGTTYTAKLTTGAHASDGMPLGAPVQWSFTTAAATPPAVTRTLPAGGAGDAGVGAAPRAEFSKALDPATVSSATFTLSGPGGFVAASVSYDAAAQAATLTPSAALSAGATYTARLDGSIAATDGSTLGTPFSWTFTVPSSPPALLSVGGVPAAGATGLSKIGPFTAVFSRAVDASSVSGATFRLRAADSSLVPATVVYDPASLTATMTPSSPLADTSVYTLEVTTGVRGSDGGYLAAQANRSFTTGVCPCQLFSLALAPALTTIPSSDGHGSSSYELGVKVTVDQPMLLNSIRFYKDVRETGVHTGTVWTTSGTKLATVTFGSETASGWQSQALATPLLLQPGPVYVISVNANAYYVATSAGLATPVSSGQLHSVAGGLNGVFGSAAGVFPGSSYHSTNYFVDMQVVPVAGPVTPAVISTSPIDGATGVARSASVSATFSRSMDPATISGSTFSLLAPDGSQVPATVAYNASTSTASLTPSSLLAVGAAYTARLTTAAHASDGTPLSAAVQWSFTISSATPPAVSRTLPAGGAGDAGVGAAPRAEFSKALDPATVTATTFTLTGPGGVVPATVAYDAATQSATLTPSAALSAGATYTARLDGAIAATDGSTLGTPFSWTFTVPSSPPALLSVDGVPAAGATGVSKTGPFTAVFSRTVDTSSVGAATVRLRAADSSLVPAAVSYDPSSLTATLTPSAPLADTSVYTLEVTTGVRGSDGGYLAAQANRSFTTGVCPCQLFPLALAPARTTLPSADGHGSSSYELGVKVTVDQPMLLSSIRFYKDDHETGVHTGTVWTTSGVKLATVTFGSETAFGWQSQALATPLQLQPGTVYVVSVNVNAYYVATAAGLATQASSGPLHSVADGADGVFALTAGSFPSQSWNSTNYFVDVLVR